MEYFEQHYPHYHPGPPHDQFPPHLLALYHDPQHNLHNYGMAQSTSQMGSMPPKPSETKPRLTKDEVDILEAEFKKNPKPTTQTKKQYAAEMMVDLARINNWFQNRRAKSKHEKRQAAMEAGQLQNPDALPCSEPSSPDFFSGNGYFSEDSMAPLQHAATFPMMSGPPPPVAPYHPQYTDPSTASMESLNRTMAAAEAAAHNSEYQAAFSEDGVTTANHGEGLLSHSLHTDHDQFSSSVDSLFHFNPAHSYSYAPHLDQNFYNPMPQPMPEPVTVQAQTATSRIQAIYEAYSAPSEVTQQGAQVLTNFPSQLLPTGTQEGQSSLSHDGSESRSPEESNALQTGIDFKYDTAESDKSSPPASSLPFRSPPPPTDLASRRKKVHVKPAHLIPETLKSRPPMGPRTVSHAEGLRRPSSDSPVLSPMRRIASAGGNRGGMVISGRISKSGVESAQRSPINLGGFADAGAFLEHNYHTIRYPHSLTAGSSLNSSLAPPTPMSPRDGGLSMGKSDGSRSTASPSDTGMNLVFNHTMPGCYPTMEGDQNLASPPETPQAHLLFQPTGHWGLELQEKPFHYEIPDEPLYTPAHDTFQLEMHQPQPQPHYLSSMSQPVTPAFGHFNSNFMFAHESPRFEQEAPQFAVQMPGPQPEYAFLEGQTQQFPTVTVHTSPSTRQKTFQFSNSTPADFLDK